MLLSHWSWLSAQTFHLTAFDQPEGYELKVTGEEEIRLIISGFSPGDDFGLQLRHKPGQGKFDYGNLPAGTYEYHNGFIAGSTLASELDICLETKQSGPGTLYFTLRKNRALERRKSASSPFEVTNSNNLDSLLNVVFRNASCFELYPDTIITGDQVLNDGRRVMQTGVFTGGTDVFGMESGIILSTGAVTDANGPNSITPRSQNVAASNSHVDPDAASLIPPQFCSPTPMEPFCYDDVAIIEFEFVPTSDTISFNYIFFSEEYCFALNAGFGDAFAFFLEGPNVQPNGRANIARLPNGERVSSETLNHIVTPTLFRDNSFNSISPCTGTPNDPTTEQQVAYDGFSTKLQIKAAVTPCERHVLKLMVIDALDFNLDSGILLEAGSFTAGLIADPETSVAGVADNFNSVEGCDTASITFSRLFSNPADLLLPLSVNYNLMTTGGGITLAENGNDFELPPSPFIIPPGNTSATLKIPILADADSAEGMEAFIIRYDGTCNCEQNLDTFYIQDAADLVLDVTPDQSLCTGQLIELSIDVIGGIPGYTYSWPDGQDTRRVTYTANGQDTLIYVSVVDSCGQMGRDSIMILASDVSASTTGTYSLCSSPTADVLVDVEGLGPFTIELRIDTNGIVTTTPYLISGDTSFTFSQNATINVISVTNASGCSGTTNGTATVTDGNFSVAAIVTDVLCAGQATGAISITINNNSAGYNYLWDPPQLNVNNITNLTAGNYSVTATELSAGGCQWDSTFNIMEPASAITFLRDSSRDETCSSAAFASATYTGGTGSLNYRWNNGTEGSVLGEVPPGQYQLTITDENSCEMVQSFNLMDRRVTLLANISATAAELSCSQNSLMLSAQQNTVPVTHTWRNETNQVVGNTRTLTITMAGTYTVLVEDPTNGCTAMDTISITRSGELLDLVLPSIHPINCNDQAVDLTVSHPTFTNPVDYAWYLNGTLVGTNATLPGVTNTGVYEVTVTRQDNGCAVMAQTEVLVDRNDPTVSVPAPIVTSSCISPNVTITVAANGPYAYTWSTSDGQLSGPINQISASVSQPGTYSILVKDTINGCTTVRSVQVVQDRTTLTALAGSNQSLVCTGQGTVLFGQFAESLAGSTGRWYGPSGSLLSENRQAFATEAGAFVFEAIHPLSGCSSFDTMMVISEAPSSVEYTLQQAPCPELGGRLFVTNVVGNNGPFTFTSPTGQTEPFGSSLRGLAQGNNVLIVTDQLGCELRDTFQIFDFGSFTGQAPDVTIELGEEAILGVETNRGDGALVQWEWGNLPDSLACTNCPEPSLRPLESFIATVAVTDTNGCMLTLRQNVIVAEQELVYLPNAFSPHNSDGVNDIYAVFGNPEFIHEVNSFGIFNRWGDQVFANNNFSVNDPAAGWDGMIGGRTAPAAVYVYTITYTLWDGREKTLRGSFSLVH